MQAVQLFTEFIGWLFVSAERTREPGKLSLIEISQSPLGIIHKGQGNGERDGGASFPVVRIQRKKIKPRKLACSRINSMLTRLIAQNLFV